MDGEWHTVDFESVAKAMSFRNQLYMKARAKERLVQTELDGSAVSFQFYDEE